MSDDPVDIPNVRVARSWSDADVVTLSEAARRLGLRRATAVTWLRSLGLVATLPWGERVVWGAVRQAVEAAAPAARSTSTASRVRIPAGITPRS